jgi:rubredoxin
MNKLLSLVSLAFALSFTADAFSVPSRHAARPTFTTSLSLLRMSEEKVASEVEIDPMEEEEMDSEARIAMEKSRRADELRAQEVFMKKSTGIHKCTNCDWQYDETKGDTMMIGGQIQPGTLFEELPSNWRCPVCRASKDSFQEIVQEIPGFEVNQGYGFGAFLYSHASFPSNVYLDPIRLLTPPCLQLIYYRREFHDG